MNTTLKSDLKFNDKKIQAPESNSISREDKTIWFIWIGLIFIAVAALPFIARIPNVAGFVLNLCVSIIP